MVPNTLPLETTLANWIGTDVVVQTDVLTPIQGSTSVILMIKGYQNKAGQLKCADRMGKVWLRRANRRGREMQVLVGVRMNNILVK